LLRVNGYLMTVDSLTHSWTLWRWLCPLELVIFFGSAALTIHLRNDGQEGRDLARRMATQVMRPTLIAAAVLAMIGLVFG